MDPCQGPPMAGVPGTPALGGSQRPGGPRQRRSAVRSISTANFTSLSACKAFLATFRGQILLGQECKALQDDIADLQHSLLSQGWVSHWAPAVWTGDPGQVGQDRRHVSAGCAIFTAKHLDAWPHHSDKWSDFPGRVVAVSIRTQDMGGIVAYSIYLKTGDDLGGFNGRLLEAVARDARCHRRPFIIGGDWQNGPEELLASSFHQLLHGRCVAPVHGTCRQRDGTFSTIDFFYLHADLWLLTEAVEVNMCGTITPHREVTWNFKAAAKEVQVLMETPLPLPPVEGIIGPRPQPPSWATEVGAMRL